LSIAAEPGIGQQQHHGIEPSGLAHQERLAAQIALLHRPLVRQERRQVEGVGPDLRIRVAEPRPQEVPPARPAVGANHDRCAAQRLEAVVAGAWMRQQNGRVALEHRSDGHEGQVLTHEVQRQEAVGRQGEVEPPGQQQLRLIHLRPALADADVQSVPGIDAGGLGLVVAAVFGFRSPIQAERHFVGRLGRCAANQDGKDDQAQHRDLAGVSLAATMKESACPHHG